MLTASNPRSHFSGVGYTNLSLDCRSAINSDNYGSDSPMIDATSDYSCSLSRAPVVFTGYTDVVPLMPHTYYTRSCTIESLTNTTTITLREYRIESETDDGNKTALSGSFTLHNPGPGDTYRLHGIPILDDGAWHECTAGSEPLPWQLVGCRYLLNRETHMISFQVQWYCDDRDPSHA